MLQSLEIRNYAIIEHVRFELDSKLNILTGETGAGKSIIIGALGLLTGARVDKNVLYNTEEKCIIEGEFAWDKNFLKEYFDEEDIDYSDSSCILRREILENGRSRAFINDTPVKLSHLKYIGERIIDIHSQHKILDLSNKQYQIDLVDQFGDGKDTLSEYKNLYQAFLKKKKDLQELTENAARNKADLDYWQFQMQEFDELALKVGEQEELETELKKLNNSELINSNLQEANQALSEGELAVTDQLKNINVLLDQIAEFHPDLKELTSRIESTSIEIDDIAQELSIIGNDIQTDDQQKYEIESRLNSIYRLQTKHACRTIEELLEKEAEIQSKVNSIENADEIIAQLEREIEANQKQLEKLAASISQNRSKTASKMDDFINLQLPAIGMQFALLKIEISPSKEKELNANGWDNVQFLLSPDKGNHFLPMSKSASGGELSRIMLCIKQLTAKNSSIKSIVFDEIDTGISGDIAGKVGEIIESLANDIQITCITHLPQIASKGKSHYFISKHMEKGKTVSQIKKLNGEERVNELAVMLSSKDPSAIAIKNAKELLKN